MLILIFFNVKSIAQTSDVDTWDNNFWFSNKMAYASNKFRYSGEIQVRLKEDFKELENWFFEFIPSYSFNKHWDIQVPLRYSIKPNLNEFRPGLSVFYKIHAKEDLMLNNQVMYQADISSEEIRHAVRYVLTSDWRVNELWSLTGMIGALYRWQDDFTGIQLVRLGPGASFHIDNRHEVNFHYLLGIKEPGSETTYQGICYIQLLFNFGKGDYKPSRILSFE